MKKFILLSILALFAIVLKAQTEVPGIKGTKNVILKTVPKNLHIEDKIYIRNKSPYYLVQIVVAIPNENGELEPLGVASHIAPNETFNMAYFKNNKLKKLRGKTIAIKAKGAKIFTGGQNGTTLGTPRSSESDDQNKINSDDINNIKQQDFTYNFEVNLAENRHDLYIELFSGGENGEGLMDF